jgi:hypothetical protein
VRTPNRLVVALILLAAAGCGGQSTSQANQPAAPAQAVPATAPCDNAFIPVKAGAKWTYTGTNNVTSASKEVNTITDVGSDTFTVSVDTGDKVSWTETWTCTKAGLLQLQNNGGALSAMASGPDGTATVTTKSNTGITLPLNPKPGDTWTQTTEVEIKGSGVTVDAKSTSTYKAVGQESVTVPGGTFDAMRIDGTVNSVATFADGKSMPVNGTVSSWWVRGKGMVKAISSTSSIDTEIDLQSYQIP